MKKRVVIYARFSSHSQTEQSIEGQLRECYDFARRNDYLVIWQSALFAVKQLKNL